MNKRTDRMCISGAVIITMNENLTVHNPGEIIFDGGIITYIGPVRDGDDELCSRIDGSGHIMIPGLINTHTHLGMSLFRTLGDDMANRLKNFIFPLENRVLDADLVYWAALHSLSEMISGGTTTCADMYYFSEATARAADQANIRAVVGQSVTTAPAADAAAPREAFDRLSSLIRDYRNHPRITPAIAPHAPYSLTREDHVSCAVYAAQKDISILSHLAEMPFEEDYTREHFGLPPVEFYLEVGMLGDRSLMAHCINVAKEDISLLKKTGTGIAHNPSANSKSGKGIAPAYQMYKQGCRIGLGTDGPMSVNTQDLISELNLTAKLQKVSLQDPLIMNAREVLYMATMGGARALGMERRIGSLEVGKAADITIISTDSPALFPVYDPYSAIVYGASASDVSHVFVGGKPLLYDRKLLTLDTIAIREASTEYTERIRKDFT
jgi:cytosine/adenosine deaminase-related metal-dependent hydrolase